METTPSVKDDVPQKILLEESPDMLSLVNESFRPLAVYLRLSSAMDILLILILLVPFLINWGGWSLGLQSGCLLFAAFVAHIIGVFVSYGRRPQVIYSLSHDYLTSEGGLTKNNFKLPISEIDEITSNPRSSTRTDIFIYAKRALFVLPGLRTRKAKELIALLPERLQEGGSERFHAWLESLVANLEMDDNHRLDPIDIRKRIDSEIAQPENIITLSADFSRFRKGMFTWLPVMVLIGFVLVQASPNTLWFWIPLLMMKGVDYGRTMEKTRDCIFIYSDNSLFEIDCKRQTVCHYKRNQAELKSEKTDDGINFAWIRLKKITAIPFKVDGAALEKLTKSFASHPNADVQKIGLAQKPEKKESEHLLNGTFGKMSLTSSTESQCVRQEMLDWNQCNNVERFEDKVSGAWVFTGTRIPVRALFENLESGATIDDFLEWFPGVSRDHITSVLEFAEESLASAKEEF